MREIKITLPDSSVKRVPFGSTPQDVANLIGRNLGKAVMISKVDGTLKDLNHTFRERLQS